MYADADLLQEEALKPDKADVFSPDFHKKTYTLTIRKGLSEKPVFRLLDAPFSIQEC